VIVVLLNRKTQFLYAVGKIIRVRWWNRAIKTLTANQPHGSICHHPGVEQDLSFIKG
jgi:hypothetical protein